MSQIKSPWYYFFQVWAYAPVRWRAAHLSIPMYSTYKLYVQFKKKRCKYGEIYIFLERVTSAQKHHSGSRWGWRRRRGWWGVKSINPPSPSSSREAFYLANQLILSKQQQWRVFVNVNVNDFVKIKFCE